MCLSPFKLKNPHNSLEDRRNFLLSSVYDVDSSYIEVPCGVCAECLAMRQNYWLQRCELMSTDHYIFFATLTYSNDTLPFIFSTGKDGKTRKYEYASSDDFRYMIKRMRVYGVFPPGMKYLCVSEYGGRTHRPHFHVLFFIPKKSFYYANDYRKDRVCVYFDSASPYSVLNYESFLYEALFAHWKRKVSLSRKYPHYINLSKLVYSSDGRSTYDLHYVEPFRKDGKVSSDVCAYVTKYMLKPDPWIRKVKQALYNNYDNDEFLKLWRLIKPRFLFSKNFGNSEDYRPVVDGFIERCKAGSTKYDLCFFDLFTGKAYPLAPYLKKRFLNWRDALEIRACKMEFDGFDRWTSISDYRAKRDMNKPVGWSEFQAWFYKYRGHMKRRNLVLLRCNDEFLSI